MLDIVGLALNNRTGNFCCGPGDSVRGHYQFSGRRDLFSNHGRGSQQRFDVRQIHCVPNGFSTVHNEFWIAECNRQIEHRRTIGVAVVGDTFRLAFGYRAAWKSLFCQLEDLSQVGRQLNYLNTLVC